MLREMMNVPARKWFTGWHKDNTRMVVVHGCLQDARTFACNDAVGDGAAEGAFRTNREVRHAQGGGGGGDGGGRTGATVNMSGGVGLIAIKKSDCEEDAEEAACEAGTGQKALQGAAPVECRGRGGRGGRERWSCFLVLVVFICRC